MAENLNYEAANSKCYSNNTANCTTYGRLYNWATAMGGSASSSANPSGVRGVCPPNWHLPSDAEWTALTTAVGSDPGTKLRANSSLWNSNGKGTDDFGFSALPGGGGLSDGGFSSVGDYGLWWSASEDNSDSAYYRVMSYSYEGVYYFNYDKDLLFSVRCVQD